MNARIAVSLSERSLLHAVSGWHWETWAFLPEIFSSTPEVNEWRRHRHEYWSDL